MLVCFNHMLDSVTILEINQTSRQVIDPLLLKIAVDLGIFKALVGSKTPLSLDDLAKDTGADATLLARILRGLTSIDALDEVGVEFYVPNKVTRAFTTVKASSGLDLL